MHRLLPPVLFCFLAMVMLITSYCWPVAIIFSVPYNWAGILLLIAGLGIASWHARLFHRLNTNINTFKLPDKLVTAGLYRYTRNPMYLGFLMGLMGIAWLLGSLSPWVWVVVFFIVTDRWYIGVEENMLLQEFGDEYRQYQQAVRRWL
jgi:protein-S-isoprenylcysteine O-methyltransferase Ste14